MENEIKNAMKFINKINEDDSIDKYNNNIKQMKNLLNTIICELNPNIKKENIQKLDSTQLWTLISSISTKYINDFKTQTKSITEIKNELNDFNNSNYLEKKRKRNNKNQKNKSKKEEINNNEEEEEIEEEENLEKEEEQNEKLENEEEENEEEENENIENENEEEEKEKENIENEEEEEEEEENDKNINKEKEENEEENSKIKKEKDSKLKKNKKKNSLDDEFFSLEKMNEFADMLDEKDLKAAPSKLQITTRRKNSSSEINSLSSEEAEIEAEENSKEEIKFNQFFDAPENKNSKNKKTLNSDSEEGENGIFNQIKEIEKQMLSKKKWDMKGEVTSKERPIDSLLSNPMDFEIALKNPPIPNQEYTNLLENIIKNRIKDNLFDDPIFKNPFQLNKKNQNDFEINFSKSQKGLGEIYEEEYTGNKLSQNKSDEIKKECDVMCEELYKVFDRLTNAHFMPHNISSK